MKTTPIKTPLLTDADLRRKANQHWDMARLARRDNDPKDAARHTKAAIALEATLAERLP